MNSFISSGGTVYGNPPAQLIDESTHCAPLSYHGAGKVAIEAFLNAFRAAGHAVTVLRPSNAYGPGQFLEQGFGLVVGGGPKLQIQPIHTQEQGIETKAGQAGLGLTAVHG